MKNIITITLLMLFCCCKKNSEERIVSDKKPVAHNSVQTKEVAPENKEGIIKKINDDILLALKNKNYKAFSDFIHPESGIRFSMYAFVNPTEDKHFSKADFQKYQPMRTIFTWGSRDGSGEIYKATINKYIADWVFKKDFTKSEYALNTFTGGGNSLNNLKEIYPGRNFTENYIPGSEKNGGMDWNSLRFVFEEFQGKYYIIAVINDEWTI